MSEGCNRVFLLGNLGADPELRVTTGGQAVLKMRLACSESYLDKSNTRQERTEWINVTVWGKRGEALARILSKGARILVEGAIRTNSYEKDGEKRYSTEIHATNIVFAERKQGGGGGEREDGSARYGSSGYGGSAKHSAPNDDDIPFVVNMTTSGSWERP